MPRTRLLAALAPLALAAAVPASSSAATAFYGVTADNHLVEFQSDNTTTVPSIQLQGLGADERIVGLDLRPADLRLYALTSKNRFVVINPRNGAVRYVGDKTLEPAINGDRVAFDFNPVVDRIRVETNAGQNLRIDPSTGQLATATVTPTPAPGPDGTTPTTPTTTPSPTTVPGKPDGNLQYAAGDAGAGTTRRSPPPATRARSRSRTRRRCSRSTRPATASSSRTRRTTARCAPSAPSARPAIRSRSISPRTTPATPPSPRRPAARASACTG